MEIRKSRKMKFSRFVQWYGESFYLTSMVRGTMEKSRKRPIQSLLLTFILSVTLLWVGPAALHAKQMVKDIATGKMIAAPQYGGTITYAMVPRESTDTDTFGTIGHSAGVMAGHALDRIGIGDWAIHREAVGDFTVANFPLDVLTGNLAKSWELPDDTTLIFKIQEGVHFHDKAPVNGREMVADDIAYNYQRMLGIGRFAGKDRAAQNWGTLGLPIESVEASDKTTLVVKLSQPSPNALKQLFDCCHMYIYAPEIIEEDGNAEDWRKLVGTGAFQMTDWTEGSSMTYEKNPNYWRHDEKFPQNRLPYVDKIVAVFMGEEATKLAALRSGRIAYAGHLGVSQIQSIETIVNLQKTNPDLQIWPFSFRSETSFAININHPPFGDIRVRQALQMALDLKTMNEAYFQGFGEWVPMGLIGPSWKKANNPFETWPEEVKKTYSYDPEGAKKLLAEAGYPNGFKTKLETATTHPYYMNLDYTQLAVDMWSKIGVDVEIDIIEWAAYAARVNTHTYEGMVHGLRGLSWSPLFAIRIAAHSDHVWNMPGVQDPVYDAMVEAAENAGSTEELMELVKKADDYYIPQQWVTWGPMRPGFVFWQPWMVGYNGEIVIGGGRFSLYLSRVWLDSDLKEAMGH
jgi:peptide/nickel transport system substrate-binding protein